MAALSARRLVWSDTWPTVFVTSPMLAACWLNCSMIGDRARLTFAIVLDVARPKPRSGSRCPPASLCNVSVRSRANARARSRAWTRRRRRIGGDRQGFLAARWRPPRRRSRFAPSLGAIPRRPLRLRLFRWPFLRSQPRCAPRSSARSRRRGRRTAFVVVRFATTAGSGRAPAGRAVLPRVARSFVFMSDFAGARLACAGRDRPRADELPGLALATCDCTRSMIGSLPFCPAP